MPGLQTAVVRAPFWRDLESRLAERLAQTASDK